MKTKAGKKDIHVRARKAPVQGNPYREKSSRWHIVNLARWPGMPIKVLAATVARIVHKPQRLVRFDIETVGDPHHRCNGGKTHRSKHYSNKVVICLGPGA